LNGVVATALVAGFSVDQDSWDYSSSQNLDFLRAGETITFSYDVVATDDSGAANDTSVAKTVTITITGTNDQPVVDLNGSSAGNDATASFTEQAAVVLTPSANITDIDSANMASLTATLTTRPDGNTVESLSLNTAAMTAAAGLTVTYTQVTGVLS